MAGNQPWDGNIEELGCEILNYNIKETSRSTLKDLGSRLNSDHVSAGNWEALAEKLGYLQDSELDRLLEQAEASNTTPGFVVLQEWGRHPGSTAFVLLHALREIQREDIVALLVDRLRKLQMMELSVNVEGETGAPRFLRVSTRKSAPLHASLDNMLQQPLYWYDITGPRPDITWSTASGQLQGTQLTVTLRDSPNEDGKDEIYGHVPSNSCKMQARKLSQPPLLQFNIPPEPNDTSDGALADQVAKRQMGMTESAKAHAPAPASHLPFNNLSWAYPPPEYNTTPSRPAAQSAPVGAPCQPTLAKPGPVTRTPAERPQETNVGFESFTKPMVPGYSLCPLSMSPLLSGTNIVETVSPDSVDYRGFSVSLESSVDLGFSGMSSMSGGGFSCTELKKPMAARQDSKHDCLHQTKSKTGGDDSGEFYARSASRDLENDCGPSEDLEEPVTQSPEQTKPSPVASSFLHSDYIHHDQMKKRGGQQCADKQNVSPTDKISPSQDSNKGLCRETSQTPDASRIPSTPSLLHPDYIPPDQVACLNATHRKRGNSLKSLGIQSQTPEESAGGTKGQRNENEIPEYRAAQEQTKQRQIPEGFAKGMKHQIQAPVSMCGYPGAQTTNLSMPRKQSQTLEHSPWMNAPVSSQKDFGPLFPSEVHVMPQPKTHTATFSKPAGNASNHCDSRHSENRMFTDSAVIEKVTNLGVDGGTDESSVCVGPPSAPSRSASAPECGKSANDAPPPCGYSRGVYCVLPVTEQADTWPRQSRSQSVVAIHSEAPPARPEGSRMAFPEVGSTCYVTWQEHQQSSPQQQSWQQDQEQQQRQKQSPQQQQQAGRKQQQQQLKQPLLQHKQQQQQKPQQQIQYQQQSQQNQQQQQQLQQKQKQEKQAQKRQAHQQQGAQKQQQQPQPQQQQQQAQHSASNPQGSVTTSLTATLKSGPVIKITNSTLPRSQPASFKNPTNQLTLPSLLSFHPLSDKPQSGSRPTSPAVSPPQAGQADGGESLSDDDDYIEIDPSAVAPKAVSCCGSLPRTVAEK